MWKGIACVSKDNSFIKPSYVHQEDVIVCRSSSLTERQITEHLSTVRLADEWQRQEKLVPSNLSDAPQSGVYLQVTQRSSGMKDGCVVEGRSRWRMEQFLKSVEEPVLVMLSAIGVHPALLVCFTVHSLLMPTALFPYPSGLTCTTLSYQEDCLSESQCHEACSVCLLCSCFEQSSWCSFWTNYPFLFLLQMLKNGKEILAISPE